MLKPTVICGFPGIGKSFAALNSAEHRIVDLDYRYFHEDADFSFPEGYLMEIENLRNSLEPKFILVSTHKAVREGLTRKNIPYVLVYPESGLSDTYAKRYDSDERGNAPKRAGFTEFMETEYDDLRDELDKDPEAQLRVTTTGADTLMDVLDYIEKEVKRMEITQELLDAMSYIMPTAQLIEEIIDSPTDYSAEERAQAVEAYRERFDEAVNKYGADPSKLAIMVDIDYHFTNEQLDKLDRG